MKTTCAASLMVLLAAVGGVSTAASADWPHLMGSQYDRKTPEAFAWKQGSLRKVWSFGTGGGFSSFVTGAGRAYTVVADGGRETTIAVDRKTGKLLWSTPLTSTTDYPRGGERGAKGNDGGDGPRATPTFADGKVFVFGARFDLYALDAATGKVLWKHDLIKEYGGKDLQWYNSASPLVVRDRVIVAGGGAGQAYLAFKADTGALVWKAGTDRATYASPVLTKILGQEQILFMMEAGVVSRDAESGRELWRYPFPFRVATAVTPVVWEDIVHMTAGYGVGGGACKVSRKGDIWEAAELWRSPGNRDTASHWMTPVVHEGFLYGCYGHADYGGAAFKCIDIRTGKVRWERKGFGHGQVIMVGNRLLATTDAGKLVLLEPTPDAYKEIASTAAIDGKVWSSPVLSDGQVLLRSSTGGVCLEL